MSLNFTALLSFGSLVFSSAAFGKGPRPSPFQARDPRLPEIRLLIAASLQRLPIDPLAEQGRTPFKKLTRNFEKATAPPVEEIKGWYAGRCFYFDSPTLGVASLFAAESSGDERTNGPAFSSADYRRLIPLISSEAPPDYFDTMTAAKEKAVRAVLKSLLATTAYPIRSEDSLLVQGLRTEDFEARNYWLRRDKRFLFLRLECTEPTFCMNYPEGVPTNRVLTYEHESPIYCYYFKRVKD